MIARIALVILISFPSLNSTAQSIGYDYVLFTTEDGLPHNNVLEVYQDSYGLLWVGTYNGLCIYDGNSFKTHNSVFRQKSNNWVHAIGSIYEDDNKNIWVGSWGGLISCFVRKEQKFKRYPSSHNTRVNCFKAIENNIWVGYSDGKIGLIDPDNDITKHYTICDESIDALAYCDDGLVVCTKSKVYVFDLKSKEITPIPGILNNAVDYVEDRYGDLYFIDWTGLGKITYDTTIRFQKRSITQNFGNIAYYKVASSHKSDFIYYTDLERIYELNTSANTIDSFTISDHIAYSNDAANSFIEDNTGTFWMGTVSGLLKVNKNKSQFSKYSTAYKKGKLTNNYVRAIYQDKQGFIWTGFKQGTINKLAFNELSNKYTLEGVYPLKIANQSLISNYTINCFLENNNQIIAGGESGLFVKQSNYFSLYMPNVLSGIYLVWSLHKDAADRLWIGTGTSGLYIWDSKKNMLNRYTTEDSCGLNSNSIWTIYEDSFGTIWIGTDNGLYYTKANSTEQKQVFKKIDNASPTQIRVWSIAQKGNDLYIGTTGDGLYKLSLTTTKIKAVKGISEKVISSVVVDKYDNLWLSTVKGLYKYCDNRILHFTEKDGLISNDFNFNVKSTDAEGRIFLGTKSGMISFDPGKTNKSATDKKIPVLITSFIASGESFIQDVYKHSAVCLERQQNNLEIGCAYPNYSQQNVWYRYKSDKSNQSWTYLSKKQTNIILTNVPQGNYNLIVQASTDKILWSPSTEVNIYIKPAFWQRPLFWIIVIPVLLIIITLAIRNYFQRAIKRVRKHATIQKKIAELELTALQSQMNPHFVFNTINSIQHFIINHDVEEANQYLTQLAYLMRLFLESSTNKFILLKNEIKLLSLYLSFEKLRFEDKMNYEIEVDESLQTDLIEMPSLLVQPFIENAIKHGIAHKNEKGLVKICFKKTNNGYIECIIDDNGIGREAAKSIKNKQYDSYISRGLQLIEDRIKTYNNMGSKPISMHIIDKNSPLKGTTVTIKIPVNIHKN